tara:strand:+ start:745 stop:1008 length:264 start_codon:yes stop_codon:yes gene_type:complete
MSNDTKEKVYLDGLFFKEPNPEAPEWVLSKVSIIVDKMIASLKTHESDGWVNLELKKGQDGSYYMNVDTWKPDPSKRSQPKEEKADF